MTPPDAETEQGSWQSSQALASMGEQYKWSDIAIHPIAGAGAVIGVLVVVVGGFLATLYNVLESPETGLVQTAVWFNWIGLTLIAVSLVFGGMLSQTARSGVRVAMVAIGLFVLTMSTNTPVIPSGFPGF